MPVSNESPDPTRAAVEVPAPPRPARTSSPAGEPIGTRNLPPPRRPGAPVTAFVLRMLGQWLLIAALAFGASACAREEAPSTDRAAPLAEVAVNALPEQARQTLALIRQGGPFPYRKDGTVFGNRERLLPRQPRGYYTEYTVPTPGSRDRGARRIVAGKGATGDPATSGEYYYTDDHYQSFRRIRP
jgi:ribonuclease T1